MAAQTNLYMPASSHVMTGKIVNATGAFSLAAGTATNSLQLTLDNATTNTNWLVVRSLIITSDDASLAHTVAIGISPDAGVTFIPLGNLNVPINAGTLAAATTPSVDALNNSQILGLPKDVAGNKIIVVPAGCQLLVGSLVAVTSGKAIYFSAIVDVY